MPGLIHDLRFALRILIRSPWFAALAVFTLALGIGANAALFSLVDAVLLRGLPFKDSERLVEIWGRDAQRSGMRVPGPFLEALRERARTIESISLHGPIAGVLQTREGVVEVSGERVGANFTEVFGVPPMIGRGFLPDEDQTGAPAVMLVSYRFWQRHMGADSAAIGQTLYLGSVPHTVVGVMPPEFRTEFRRVAIVDYWTPYVSDQVRALELENGYELIGRLASGATIEEARREVASITAGIEFKGFTDRGRTLGMVPLKEEVIRDSANPLKLLLVAVAVVLTIACANLAQLLLARSDRRVREFATRKAIGATASQVFRLALIESLLLSMGGGMAGVALAYLLLPAVLTLAPTDIPRIADAAINLRVLSVAVGLTFLTGCAFGLAPALRLSRLSVSEALANASGRFSPAGGRFRSMLVVVQVAASVALFALAGLIGQSFLKLLPTDPGFEPESRSAFFLFLSPRTYPAISERQRILDEILSRVRAIGGVDGASAASEIPFTDDYRESPVVDLNNLRPDGTPNAMANPRAISPNLFQVLGIPLIRGRDFNSSDGAQSPGVAIVNEKLARSLAPDSEVLGRVVRVGRPGASVTPLPSYQIVGVVGNTRSTGTTTDILNEIYVPYSQSNNTFVYLIVRSQLGTDELTRALRAEIRTAAPEQPLRDTQTAAPMTETVRQSQAVPRFSATLISAFSAMALLLAAIGVFGLVAYSVSQRQHEFGIRAALGARPRDLALTAVRSAVVLTAVGILGGLGAAVYLSRFVESYLYEIRRLDPPTFAGAAVLMIVVACLAALIPARRAMRASLRESM
ncbi:MAG: ABC transporter permease [Acidobacteria bacterium]|nr:ABC transporter permease [Acidobacteriota bacterium]